MDISEYPIKKQEKFLQFHVIMNHLSMSTARLRRRFASFIPGIWPFRGLAIVKNKLKPVFMRLSFY